MGAEKCRQNRKLDLRVNSDWTYVIWLVVAVIYFNFFYSLEGFKAELGNKRPCRNINFVIITGARRGNRKGEREGEENMLSSQTARDKGSND